MEDLIKLKTDIGVQLTDRELSVRWWGRLSTKERENLLETFLPTFSVDNINYETQYWIWLKQQKL